MSLGALSLQSDQPISSGNFCPYLVSLISMLMGEVLTSGLNIMIMSEGNCQMITSSNRSSVHHITNIVLVYWNQWIKTRPPWFAYNCRWIHDLLHQLDLRRYTKTKLREATKSILVYIWSGKILNNQNLKFTKTPFWEIKNKTCFRSQGFSKRSLPEAKKNQVSFSLHQTV